MLIRIETADDFEAIRKVHRLAFGREDEARLVDALREGGYARVSLVVEADDQLVGHILFSELPIICETRTVSALALAPLAVLPKFQRQGIGSQLIRRGLEVCREEAHRIVIVLGHPDFYPRFGFSAERALALDSPFSGRPSFMAMELVEGALGGVSGRVQYAAPFEIPRSPRGRMRAIRKEHC